MNILPDATPDEIRRAYHEAARRLHPDVSEEPNAIEIFLEVQKAYEILTDQEKRSQYDRGCLSEIVAELKCRTREFSSPQLHIQIQYSRAQLAVLNEPQIIYTLLEIATPSDIKGRKVSPPLNVCLVLDRSTSMQGERMDAVKATAIELVRQMRPHDVLSIVTFSDRADIIIPAVRQFDRTDAELKISMLRPDGGTELLRGLEAGIFEIQRNLSSKRINQIILITDGRTYGDESDCLQLANNAAARGIRINGLGIGANWNDDFLDELTTRTGGRSIYLSHVSDLNEFLQEMFKDMGEVFGDQTSLTLELSPGVALTYAYRLHPDTAPLPAIDSLKLGNLLRESKLVILLEFTIEPLLRRAYQHEIARGSLMMQIHSLEPTSFTHHLQLSRPIDQLNSNELPPNDIVQALSYISLYRMQENVHTELFAGNIEAANKQLEMLATQLISRGENELAQTALKEADRLRATQAFSIEGRKQIKYGTRSLALPSIIKGIKHD